MASYPLYGQPNSARFWNLPPYDDQFRYPHRRFENGAIFQTRQLPSDQIEEVIAQEAQVQVQEQTTGSGTKGKGKGKANYDKWTNEEQSFLVDLTQLEDFTLSMRMQQTRQKLSRQNLSLDLPRTIAILSPSADRP